MQSAITSQARLIAALRDAARGTASAEDVRVIETHSSVRAADRDPRLQDQEGRRLGFLDFTTLAARRHYCEEELRLNRRHARHSISTSSRSPAPSIAGRVAARCSTTRSGCASSRRLRCLERPRAKGAHGGAHRPSRRDGPAFHETVAVAAANGPFGTTEEILQLALDNFTEIRPSSPMPRIGRRSTPSRRGTGASMPRAAQALRRPPRGRLRARVSRRPALAQHRASTAFRRFSIASSSTRGGWIDVVNEVAFTVMDLAHRGRPTSPTASSTRISKPAAIRRDLRAPLLPGLSGDGAREGRLPARRAIALGRGTPGPCTCTLRDFVASPPPRR